MLLLFGYPGYPEDIMLGRMEESRKHLDALGVSYTAAKPVINLSGMFEAREEMRRATFDRIICVVATWIEVTHVCDLAYPYKDMPILLWCHENLRAEGAPGYVSLGSVAAAGVLRQTFEEFGFRFKFVVGNPSDKKIERDITAFSGACDAMASLREARIGLVGYASMGMYTAMADHIKIKSFFGAEIAHVDQYSVLRGLDEIDSGAVEEVVRRIRADWEIGGNVRPGQLETTAKIYLRLKDLMKERALYSLAIKCQYEMSLEYNFSPCMALSLLGSECPVCCEGDVHEIISQMVLEKASRGKVTAYGDILHFNEDGVVCAACGFAPRCFLRGPKPAIDCHTAIISGIMTTSPFREQQVTMARLARAGAGFKMHLIKGKCEPLENFHEIGCPQYAGMTVRFENKSVEDFKNEIMSQHYAIVEGDYLPELTEYCKLAGITAV